MATTHEVEPIDDLLPPPPMPPARKMTEEDFEGWCRGSERVRAEWIDGEVNVMSPVNLGHLRLGEFLFRVLGDFVEARGRGEVHGAEFFSRFRAGSRLLRRLPDVWFLAEDRLHLLRPTYLDGPPDLVVEIVSPDSIDRDYREKFQDYESGGVREYWVVDPLSKRVEVWTREGEPGAFRRVVGTEGRLESAVLPGFFLRPEWLWREPLPKVSEVLQALGV